MHSVSCIANPHDVDSAATVKALLSTCEHTGGSPHTASHVTLHTAVLTPLWKYRRWHWIIDILKCSICRWWIGFINDKALLPERKGGEQNPKQEKVIHLQISDRFACHPNNQPWRGVRFQMFLFLSDFHGTHGLATACIYWIYSIYIYSIYIRGQRIDPQKVKNAPQIFRHT